MCAARTARARRVKPVRRLTTPPGQVGGRERLGELDRRAAGCVSEATTTTALPLHDRRREPRDEPSSAGSSGASDGDDAGRLGHREVEVRPGDRVRAAEHLRRACRPSPRTRRRGRSRARPRRRPRSTARARSARARLHHLGERGRAPGRGCTAVAPAHFGNAPRAALTASRASLREARRDVLALGLVRCGRTPSAGTRRRCRACRSCGPAAGSSRRTSGTASSPCSPPSRPKPDSL